MTATALPLPAAEPRAHPLRWWILAVILAVEVMDLLDGTIVNVALPAIRSDLGSSLSSLQWIAGGYALAFSIGLVTGGRLGDIYGRRRMFLIGVAGFTLASALCGAAQSTEMLIVLRLVQGLFAATMIPQGFGIVKQVFPADEIGKAFGMFGPVIGGSAVLGPVIGGLLVDGNLFGSGWRMIFLVNVPLGLAALAGGRRLLPESRAEVRPTLDVPGALLVSAAIGLIVYPLIQGRTLGWPAYTYAMIAAGLVVLGLFVLVELRRERRGVSPLVTMSLFHERAFSAGLATVLVFFGGMIGLMFTFSIYLQIGFGYSAVAAGVAFMPWAAGTAAGAGLGAGLLAPRIGRHTLHLALGLMALGIAGMLGVAHHELHHVSLLAIAGPELVAGAGMGAVLAPLFSFILAGVADDEVGSASGVLNAVQQLAGAAGIALIGTLFFSVAATHGLPLAFTKCLWVELAALAGCALLVLLLPREPRPEEI
ncbi:MAG TPA: MFS transporter [Gaiellaceae bacterium]|nr:MFS transporter [Gaiellaceae bacterium]